MVGCSAAAAAARDSATEAKKTACALRWGALGQLQDADQLFSASLSLFLSLRLCR